ncbi:RagB/SusD domain-containing protein [Candidatus Symbiothrix dinenymphae]|nr:RagB/SusD domain-containing protein [Candidatus Symbiothrix dinenymphae]
MKKNIYKTIIAAVLILPSCSDYLDVVPDKSMTLENFFTIREEAAYALARTYSYLPHDEDRSSSWLLGDEWVNSQSDDAPSSAYGGRFKGIHIMKRFQSADDPLLGTWSGTGLGNDLYEGINICNLFIDRVDGIHDMRAEEIADWKAQVKFLKAYYHFLLLRQYGPIAIMDAATSPDTNPKDQFVLRSKIDDCFDYIIRTMDEAIQSLLLEKNGNDLGQVDKLAAVAIKARVLLYRASPFYSGNTDYFDFYDHDKKPFFPQDNAATTKAKWQDAEAAIDAAIALCEANRKELYTYKKRIWSQEINDAKLNPRLDTLYTLRWLLADQWNEELIWGQSNISPYSMTSESLVAVDANIVLPNNPLYQGTANNPSYSRNLLGATYKMLERFYTKNGLPLDDDITFDRDHIYDHVFTPDTTGGPYDYLGFLQSHFETIQLYLDREPRFYANMGITGGYWRGHNFRIATDFYNQGQAGGNIGGSNRFWTGIGTQKVIHPNSRSGGWGVTVFYPLPLIRFADL